MQTIKCNLIRHFSIKLNTTFEKFIRHLEGALGRFNPKQLDVHFEAPALLEDTRRKMQWHELGLYDSSYKSSLKRAK